MEYYQYLWELGNVNFEYGEYDYAVQCLTKCYSISDVYKEEIVKSLYACFITPNIEEFNDTFKKHKRDENICVFDFVPVTETKYYVYDTVNKSFPFAIETAKLKVEGQKKYRGVFITGGYNINKYIEAINCSVWDKIYLFDDDTDPCINSLYKIPQWVSFFEDNVVVFKKKDEIKEYFLNNIEEYLPEIIGDRNSDFENLFEEIYNERLHGTFEFPDPILSICIPTYNRGLTALRNVKKLLNCKLTSEIEILVSNNGSDVGIEYYNSISDIDDNRLSYYKSEKNMKYYGNILRCLEKAKGKYVLFVSDEDEVYTPNLVSFINFVINHNDCAAFNCGEAILCHEKGLDAINWAGKNNYMSGITINKRIFDEDKIIELIREKKDNYYCTLYTHAAIMIVMGEKHNLYETGIPIIIKGDEDEYNSELSKSEGILEYTKLSSRIKQFDHYVEFVKFLEEELRIEVILEYYQHTLGMLLLASRKYKEYMNYFDICCSIYTYIREKITNNKSGYQVLNFDKAIRLICNITIHFCVLEYDYDLVNKMIDFVNNNEIRQDEISGYKYREFLLDVSKKISK